VAEGIETAEQAEELARLGCEVAQGYFFARPLDPDSRLLAAQPQLL
jgi:diguanylate cyclase